MAKQPLPKFKTQQEEVAFFEAHSTAPYFDELPEVTDFQLAVEPKSKTQDKQTNFGISFIVNTRPPYKQSPADPREKDNQRDRLESLKKIAREKLGDRSPLESSCAVHVRYIRALGASDAGNIINGILDGLQGIAFLDDRQVVEVSYKESRGTHDQYAVTVTELSP